MKRVPFKGRIINGRNEHISLKMLIVSILVVVSLTSFAAINVEAKTPLMAKPTLRVSEEENIRINGKDVHPSEYLKELKAPANLSLTPHYSKGILTSFDYSFNAPQALKQISRIHDFGDTPRYTIYTEALYSIDNKHTYGLIKSNHNSGQTSVFNSAELVYFYESMFEYGDSEVLGTYEFKFGTCTKLDDDGVEKFGFDDENHCLNLKIRYVVLDTTTGILYTSPYSSTVSYGKGYPKKIDAPVESIPYSPQITEYGRKFYYPYDSDIISPYYMICLKNDEQVDILAAKNSGSMYIGIDLKKNGEWFRYTNLDYLYFCTNEEIYMYLSSDYNDLSIEYDLDKIEVRARYEFYLGDDSPYNYDGTPTPYSVGDYCYATLKF